MNSRQFPMVVAFCLLMCGLSAEDSVPDKGATAYYDRMAKSFSALTSVKVSIDVDNRDARGDKELLSKDLYVYYFSKEMERLEFRRTKGDSVVVKELYCYDGSTSYSLDLLNKVLVVTSNKRTGKIASECPLFFAFYPFSGVYDDRHGFVGLGLSDFSGANTSIADRIKERYPLGSVKAIDNQGVEFSSALPFNGLPSIISIWPSGSKALTPASVLCSRVPVGADGKGKRAPVRSMVAGQGELVESNGLAFSRKFTVTDFDLDDGLASIVREGTITSLDASDKWYDKSLFSVPTDMADKVILKESPSPTSP